MLDLAGADPEGQRSEGANGVDVWESPHTTVMSRLREAQLRADGVNDALIGVAQGMQAHAELGAVRTQCLDLSAAGDIGDGQVDVERGGVVVLGGQSQVRAANSTARQTQPLEGLGAVTS